MALKEQCCFTPQTCSIPQPDEGAAWEAFLQPRASPTVPLVRGDPNFPSLETAPGSVLLKLGRMYSGLVMFAEVRVLIQ